MRELIFKNVFVLILVTLVKGKYLYEIGKIYDRFYTLNHEKIILLRLQITRNLFVIGCDIINIT